jgi:hypothetical protein
MRKEDLSGNYTVIEIVEPFESSSFRELAARSVALSIEYPSDIARFQ